MRPLSDQPEAGGAAGPSQSERLARAAWSRISEPADQLAGALVAAYGPEEALQWLRSAVTSPQSLDSRFRTAVERWAPRLEHLSPARDLEMHYRLGGLLVIPGDPAWPERLADLDHAAPHCLWVRGRLPNLDPAIAIVGSRACTRYGESVASEFAFHLTERGHPVISGGAYGIDAAAHRGALGAGDGAPTVAVLAGGADRLYPAGNASLLQKVIAEGALITEMPPGASPGRHRFLSRNRIIAALAGATVVVEAAHRSGALSTANHASELLRPLGAVPGPVTSVASSGCHRLLREGQAVCVTTPAEVIELASPAGSGLAPLPSEEGGSLLDGLDPLASRVLDALPSRAGATVENLARVSGLAPREVLTALGTLELDGKVRRASGRWARA